MDRLQGMAVFVRVAELGSFAAAARALNLSKSAVSEHVTGLEERLGVRLMNRTTRRLALTEVGAVQRDHCARVVHRAPRDRGGADAERPVRRPARGKASTSQPASAGYHAAFPPQRHPSAKLRAFVDFLVERLGRCHGRPAS